MDLLFRFLEYWPRARRSWPPGWPSRQKTICKINQNQIAQNYVIRESHPIHFKGLKPPPWSGNKPTHKLETIKAITKQVN